MQLVWQFGLSDSCCDVPSSTSKFRKLGAASVVLLVERRSCTPVFVDSTLVPIRDDA